MILKNASVMDDSFNRVSTDVAITGERISEMAPGLSGNDTVDLSGYTLVPGFVDIHIHGCVGSDTCAAAAAGLAKMCAHLVTKGVTSFCPTTMTISRDGILESLQTVRKCMEQPPEGARIVGVNMEGPYINIHKKGAQAGEHVKAPSFQEFREYYEQSGRIIKLVDVAPECEGGDEMIRNASKLCTVSIAHTEANYETAKHAFDLGATHVTHLYNAMPGMSHRAPGTVGAVLDDERVRAEVICDGFHIHPAVVRVTFAALGENRSVVVSDSMRAAGQPDGTYTLGGQEVFVKDGQARLADGTIAGSTTNLHQELKNLLRWGVPFRQAIKSVTINPAKEIHMEDQIGSIRVGKYADLVVLDSDWNIKMVFVHGKLAVDNR